MRRKFISKIDWSLDKEIDEQLDSFVASAVSGFRDGLDGRRSGAHKKGTSPASMPPDFLYKYVGWSDDNFEDVLQSILVRKEIRFSSSATLNDPFEVSPALNRLIDPSLMEEYCSKKRIRGFLFRTLSGKPLRCPQAFLLLPFVPWLAHRVYLRIPHQVEKLEKRYQSLAENPKIRDFSLMLSCFSEDGLEPLMWAHYASAHKGLVVRYSTKEADFSCEEYPTRFAKVRYSAIRPVFGISPNFSTDFGRVKSSNWAYEKEWRLTPKSRCRTSDVKYERVDSSCISSIYLGLRIKEEHKRYILNVVKANLPDIEVFQVALDDEKFVLRLEEVPK